jgi:magnesium transporter
VTRSDDHSHPDVWADREHSEGRPAALGAAQTLRCPSRTRHYKSGTLVAEGFPVSHADRMLDGDTDSVVWLDLYMPDRSDLAVVQRTFECHPLAVTDAVRDGQRARVDQYGDRMYANLYVAAEAQGSVTLGELSLFVTSRALVTVRKGDFEIDTLLDRWDFNRHLVRAGNGVAVLVYCLLDAVVDGHSSAVQALDDEVERLEHALFASGPEKRARRRAYDLDVRLADLRRATEPMTEIVPRFVRADARLVDEALAPYFRDVIDHAFHATETVDSARERINRMVQIQLNEQGAELNEITKKLAAWAAIIAVPTAVTGFYGQNVPYPGFSDPVGFIVSSAAIVLLSGALYWLLRHRHWL